MAVNILLEEDKIIIRKSRLAIFLFSIVIFTACKKELTDSMDITQSEWTMDCIVFGKHKTKVKCKDCHNSHAYILKFENDTLFRLNTSVNFALGIYDIESPGDFKVSYYGEVTEVGGGNDMDKKILENLPSAKSYSVYKNSLIIQTDNCEMTFRKR